MSLKKILLFVSMALATAAFVAPATASAEWLHEGVPITNNVTLEAEGTAEFETFLGGWHCTDMTAEFIFEAGTTAGRFEEFTAGDGCHGSGSLAGCQFAQTDLTGEPIIHQKGSYLRITNVTLWTEYEQTPGHPTNCGIEESQRDFHGAEYLTVKVDDRNGIERLEITSPYGGILTAFGLEVAGVETYMDLVIEEPNPGTYGF